MRLCELREKEVINVSDCRCLGNVVDIDMDECRGCIKAIILPGPGKLFGLFCRENEIVIEWCRIIRIGPDIILVDLKKEEPPKRRS